MNRSIAGSACCVAIALAGCTPEGERPEVPEELQQYVLDSAPKEIEHSRFIDFGGKVHLLGYDADPDEAVRPNGTLSVKLYWKSVSRLGPGWSLFTHLLNDRGKIIQNADDAGPLRERASRRERQALPPSRWEPGKLYVDEQEIAVPPYDPNVPPDRRLTPRITLAVGVWNGPMRLDVLSGSSHGEGSGIVAHFDTGVEPPAPSNKKTASVTQ